MSRALEAEDQGISLSVGSTSSSGLALSGATGVTFWQRLRDDSAMRLDLELHYVRIRTDGVRIMMPSIRVGWRAWVVPSDPE